MKVTDAVRARVADSIRDDSELVEAALQGRTALRAQDIEFEKLLRHLHARVRFWDGIDCPQCGAKAIKWIGTVEVNSIPPITIHDIPVVVGCHGTSAHLFVPTDGKPTDEQLVLETVGRLAQLGPSPRAVVLAAEPPVS